MGTTLVALAVSLSTNAACWAHVGDSRLYRLRGNELTLLTADHTRFGERVAPSSPIPLDLPHTNELLAALGVEPRVTPEHGSGQLADGDIYLLCSDGISSLVPAAELQRRLGAARPLDAIGVDVADAALLGGGNDNLSLVLIRVSA
jgi:protein phosphatase